MAEHWWRDPGRLVCTAPGCARPRWNQYLTCFRHHTPVSRETLYRVWHAITAEPHLSVRELARHTERSTQTVQRALCQLRRIGVLAHQEGQSRARTVLEPFSWVHWP